MNERQRKIEGVDDESFAILQDIVNFEGTRYTIRQSILDITNYDDVIEDEMNELEETLSDQAFCLDELRKRGFEFDSVDEAIKVYDAESRRRKIEARNAAIMELSVRGYDIKSNYDLKKAYAAELGKYFGIDAAEVEKALVELGTGFEILGGKGRRPRKSPLNWKGEQI